MRKSYDFLKTLGTVAVLMILLAIMIIGVIAEFAPTAIPDWMYTAGRILSVPFLAFYAVVIFKEWRKQRKAKKEQ